MALAIDASTPATLAGTGNSSQTTLASNSFTPPANSVVYVFPSDGNAGITVTGVTGGGLTFARLAQSVEAGKASMECWYAPVTTSPGAMTATVTFASGSENQARMISVIVFTGAAADQSAAHVATSQGNSVPSATLAAMASTSWGIGAVHNWDGGNPTVPAGQTVTINGISQEVTTASGDSAWMQANTAVGNSNLKINDTAPSCNHAMVAVEVLAGAAGGTDASVTAVPANATGQALPSTVTASNPGSVASPPGVATGTSPQTGGAISASSSVSALVASATGDAPPVNSILSAVVTAALSVNTGQALAPSVSTGSAASITAVAAVGVSSALVATPSAGLSVAAVDAAGVSVPLSPSVGNGASVAATPASAVGEALPAQGILSAEVDAAYTMATGAALPSTVGAGATAVSASAIATGTVLAPGIGGSANVSVTAVAAVSTGSVPAPVGSGTTSASVTAIPAFSVGSGQLPTVQASGNLTIGAFPASGLGVTPLPSYSAGVSAQAPVASASGAALTPTVSSVLILQATPATGRGSLTLPSESATSLVPAGIASVTGVVLDPSLSVGSVLAVRALSIASVLGPVVGGGSHVTALAVVGTGAVIEPLVVITNPEQTTGQHLIVAGSTSAELGKDGSQFVLGGTSETAIFRTGPDQVALGGNTEPPPRSFKA